MDKIIIVLSFCLLLSVPLNAQELSPKDRACVDAFRLAIQFDVGTEQEAFDICVDAAKSGARGAQNLIAEGYLGAGDKELAIYWFKKAAEQGQEGARLRVRELQY